MQKTSPNPHVRLVEGLLLFLAAAFFGLHYVHLAADFPNFSRWMDWSKYTDEGWYGDAAIRHYQLGHWYLPGDFNPAAALPVWPFLEGLLFHFTGVSLVAARALTVTVFGGILVLSWLLLRRWRVDDRSLAPPIAVLLLVVSPFCFVFTRLAILEPLLILLMLAALLFAGARRPSRRSRVVALGLVIPAMILTKTTALFLLPAVFWLLFAILGYQLKPFLKTMAPACIIALGLWLGWMGFLAHGNFLQDFHYLFSANGYTKISRENALSVLESTFTGGMWMGHIFFPAAMIAVVFAIASWRRLRASPLVPALLLWAGGYVSFLAYHNNLQPRYYLVVAVPLTLLLPLVLDLSVFNKLAFEMNRPFAVTGTAVLVGTILLGDATETLRYLRHPEYTLLGAARQLDQYVANDHRRDPAHNPLVLSISGSDFSLMTGLRSINDDFGTLDLVNRVAQYHPGWYAAWNQIDDDKMEALRPFFRVARVATFPAMDDPERNLLVLYRLDDANNLPFPRRPTRAASRLFRDRTGQAPSATQMRH